MKIKQHRAVVAGYLKVVDGKLVPVVFHGNGKPMFAPDGTMMDEKGHRSIFDDIADDGTEDEEYHDDGEISF